MIRRKVFNGHDEWLKNRLNGIGGSEISAIVGLNPYMNNQELWEYKTGRRTPEDISDKPYVKYGTEAEPLLRELFKLDFPQYEVFYIENNCFTNTQYPWGQASLDGWLRDQDGKVGILELKTTNILQSMQREKWRDGIPQNYYCQCLFYMEMIGAEFCILKAQLKSEFDGVPSMQTKHYRIDRADVQEDIDYLMQKGSEFWQFVQEDRMPALILPEF